MNALHDAKRWIGMAAAAAALAVLSSCANSASVPLTGGNQSSYLQASHLEPPLLPRSVKALGSGFTIPLHGTIRSEACDKDGYSIVIASDEGYANLDIFDQSANLIGQQLGVAGFGAAAEGCDTVAWGSIEYGIVVARVTAKGIETRAQLMPSQYASGKGEPIGLAIDSEGTIYSSNTPTTVIDVWSKQSVKAYHGVALPPDYSVTATGITAVHYLAADRTKIYLDGLDAQRYLALATVAFPSGVTTILQDPIENNYGSYPGGVAVDKKHEVFVNNEGGEITGYLKGVGPANESVSWYEDYYPYSYFTAIALAFDQSYLWGAYVANYYDGVNIGGEVWKNSNPLGRIGFLRSKALPYEYYAGIAASSARK